MSDTGRIAENRRIDARIRRCLALISDGDAKAFRKKFKTQPHNTPQVMHIYRELLLGAFLSSRGFSVQSEHKIDGKTPDWFLQGNPSTIVELVNLDPPHNMSKHLLPSDRNQCEWSGYPPDSRPRLYQSLWRKCTTYQEIIERHCFSFVPAIFPHFDIDVEFDGVRDCMVDNNTGLFQECPHVSGVLYFCENAGYTFTYLRNPGAVRPTELPSGRFDCG